MQTLGLRWPVAQLGMYSELLGCVRNCTYAARNHTPAEVSVTLVAGYIT